LDLGVDELRRLCRRREARPGRADVEIRSQGRDFLVSSAPPGLPSWRVIGLVQPRTRSSDPKKQLAQAQSGEPMSFPVRCPYCSTIIHAPDEMAGRRVKCPQCQQPLQLPKSQASSPPPPAGVQAPSTPMPMARVEEPGEAECD